MANWIDDLVDLARQEGQAVLIIVAAVRGSTPREAGAKMVVSANEVRGTIGGGNLEFQAISAARNMLAGSSRQQSRSFSLGASLGQCCGGAVNVVFECFDRHDQALHDLQQQQDQAFVQVIGLTDREPTRFLVHADARSRKPRSLSSPGYKTLLRYANALVRGSDQTALVKIENASGRSEFLLDLVEPSDFNIVLFGAGHVGRALVQMLSSLDCRITWVDNRERPFPDQVPQRVSCMETDAPEAEIETAAPGSYFLVMTHDHQLDQALTAAILKRDDFAWFGLIGSITKRKKFEHRLKARGYTGADLARITCPIGIDGINSKQPAAIALSVSAQLQQVYEQRRAQTNDHANMKKVAQP